MIRLHENVSRMQRLWAWANLRSVLKEVLKGLLANARLVL